MSCKIVQIFWSWYNSGIDRTEVRCMIECDSLTDLPGVDAITGYRLTIGTKAHVIDTNAVYMMQSGGAWKVQSAGTDVYTKSEIDTMMSAKQDTLSFDSYPLSASDNPVKSGGLYTYFQGVLQNGSKNQCPYNNLSAAAAGTLVNDQPINLQAGDYIITYSHTANTGATSFRLLYNGTTIETFIINNTDTGYKSRSFSLESEVNQVRVYTSVANDLTNIMIRNALLPDASYMPYVPTNRELYDMIQAL